MTYTDASVEDVIPSDDIYLWDRDATDLPAGWVVCDGNNGTPDLRNRFVVGAGASYSVGSTGGATAISLSTSQISSHNHGYTGPGDGDGDIEALDAQPASDTTGTTDTGNTGGGSNHENRPPYHSLYYVLKV